MQKLTMSIILFVTCLFVSSSFDGASQVPLSAMKPASTNFGIKRVMSGTATLGAQEYDNSVFIYTNVWGGEVTYLLSKKYSELSITFGVQDEDIDTQCGFKVLINDKEIYGYETVKSSSPVTEKFDVSDAVKITFKLYTLDPYRCVLGTPMLTPKGEAPSSVPQATDSASEPKNTVKTDTQACPIITPAYSQRLAAQLAQRVKEKSPKSNLLVIVALFKPIQIPASCEKTLPQIVQEDLLNALIETGVFTGAERDRLDEVMKELKLQQSDLFDEKKARRLGKAVGADSVLIGSISMRAADITVIQARLVDVEKGTSDVAASVTLEETTRENSPIIDDQHRSNVPEPQKNNPVYNNNAGSQQSPGPNSLWECVLDKKDGSRRHLCGGCGVSQEDARSNAVKACQRTNHPSCEKWSKDSLHTICAIKSKSDAKCESSCSEE